MKNQDRAKGNLLGSVQPLKQKLARAVPALKARARLVRRRLSSADMSSLSSKLERLDEDFVREGAEDITDTDLDTVVEKSEEIEERFRDNGPLRRLLADGRLFLDLIRDVRRGRYREVPLWTLSAVGFALLYVLNPLDVIPDTIPLLGVLDDAAVVSACFALVEQDLADYRAWRRAEGMDAELEFDSADLDEET